MAIPTGTANTGSLPNTRLTSPASASSPTSATRTTSTATATPPEGDEDVTAAAYLFRTLGDPTRLLILRHLARGEHRVVDLMSHLGLAQSTVSGHLACLRDCGLVRSRAQGRASLYSLARPELLDLFGATESFLEATGERVVLHHTEHHTEHHAGHETGPDRGHGHGEPRRHQQQSRRPGLELGQEGRSA